MPPPGARQRELKGLLLGGRASGASNDVEAKPREANAVSNDGRVRFPRRGDELRRSVRGALLRIWRHLQEVNDEQGNVPLGSVDSIGVIRRPRVRTEPLLTPVNLFGHSDLLRP